MTRKQIPLRLPPEDAEKVDAYAEREKCSRNAAIVLLIRAGLHTVKTAYERQVSPPNPKPAKPLPESSGVVFAGDFTRKAQPKTAKQKPEKR